MENSAGTSGWSVPISSQPMSSFVGSGLMRGPLPPAQNNWNWWQWKQEGEKKEKGEVLHLYRCYTHTPGLSRANPERQEEEKSGHKWRAKAKTAQEGEGNERTSRTNLCGETDLTGTGHTPQPHDTLQRGTGEELGTEWGTSWWPGWNNQNN